MGPDKLRFDFTHGSGCRPRSSREVEDHVNGWILANDPVRPITTTLKEAQALGAMALFGEKYGDVVRMVQIGAGDYSRELCGGTHVRSTAEIGVFKIVSEGSSASNVRRIEAVTGPEAVTLLRSHDALIREAAARAAHVARAGAGEGGRPAEGAQGTRRRRARRPTARSTWRRWPARPTRSRASRC